MNMDKISKKGDTFREYFKYYKANKPPPSMDNVVNMAKPNIGSDEVLICDQIRRHDNRAQYLGLEEVEHWEIFELKSTPGLIFIKNPFTSVGQRYWIRQCLAEYTKKPNKSNIDYEVKLEDWWSECYKSDDCDRWLQKKMRWTTLGYHHNWDTKVYTEESKNIFPDDLSELCDVISKALSFQEFIPQAAIVNYYHIDSTLAPHTDHSEINLEAPLFSISFGQSAIFLIGGREISDKPTAILLNSGDIIVMSKEARLCYHAVPKILPSQVTPWSGNCIFNPSSVLPHMKYMTDINGLLCDMNKNSGNGEWNRFNSYISESRININIRQVLRNTQRFLHDD